MAHCGKRFAIPCVLVLLLTPNGDTDFSTVEVTDTVSAINYNKRIIIFTAMHKKRRGTLKSGRSGKKVTSRKQAIAIGLSEARKKGKKVPKKKAS